MYILDASRRLVPVGVVGELYIGGSGVARGYLNQPELTAERFVSDPFVSEAGARMYRTGDLGRWLGDGTIEFLGRNDDQVKIRGFRIELGEVEARLSEQPGVRSAVVVAREEADGDKRLVAYVVGEEGETGERIAAPTLRAALLGVLPDYMVPAAFVTLETLPLTPNGKIDRRGLPAPEEGDYAASVYEAPQGAAEEALAEIWCELLRVERVGRHDHFFALGGHSLLAVRVVTAVRERLGVELAVGDVFTQPVLKDLAGLAAGAEASQGAAIAPADRGGVLPLSFAQQRLWFLAQMEGVSEVYHIPFAVELDGALDVRALERALDAVVTRHEVLRTTFAVEEGRPVQRIAVVGRFALRMEDVRERADPTGEVARHAGLAAAAPFDLEQGPLIRGLLVRRGEAAYTLLVTMHHIVSDGWSMGILLGELGALYRAELEGVPAALPTLPVQYADYAAWQRSEAYGEGLAAQSAYWRQRLEGAPLLLELPLDHPRPTRQDHGGGFVPLRLEASLSERLRQLGRRHDATLFMTLLAAWAAVLSRLSRQEEVVIGTPVANRGQSGIEGLIGFFVNTLALRVEVDGALTLAELVARVKVLALEAQQHQEMPFEQVVELVNPPRSLSHSPLFQAMFAWQNNSRGALDLPGLEVRPAAALAHNVAKFDLTLSLQEQGAVIVGGLEYATALFEESTVQRFAGYLHTMLEAMAEDAQQRLDEIDLVGEEERHRLLELGQQGLPPCPPVTMAEILEGQAGLAPDAVALVHEGGSLSYGQLDRLANRVAHALAANGVGVEDIVAIALPRGVEQIAAIFGVLKSGAAYLPVDVAYPAERISFMFNDARPSCVLTNAALAERLPPMTTHFVEKILGTLPTWPDRRLAQAGCGKPVGPSQSAYVIYTSGSTGQPKGVILSHRGIAALAQSQIERFALGPRARVLQLASASFDAMVMELLMAFASGGCLILPRPGALVGEELAEIIRDHGVTHALIPPPVLATMPPLPQGVLESLVVGGDACSQEMVDRWAAGRRMVNAYGPTEATACATMSEPMQVSERPTIGRPIANTRVYILDASRRLVPVGVVGELYIGGSGVARGYLNQPELTAERFVSDPFVSEAGARMYRTGDLGRWLGDGTIEFLGRNDDQVKIRGFRIELGEVEARLSEQPGVRSAVVVAREEADGDKRLVAYVVGEEGETGERIAAPTLRAALLGVLPDYMVPAAFVTLETLPLTPNGKIDRRGLPAPEEGDYAASVYEAPQGAAEEALAEIWCELLRVERVGRHDHFFALGGHSLLAVRVVTAVRERLGVELAVGDVFTQPVLKDLAASLTQGPSVAKASQCLCLEQEILLDSSIRPIAAPESRMADPSEILLTGATGFLGVFLLLSLLERTSARIHCLVRCADEASGRDRLRKSLASLGLSSDRIDARVAIVPGDLAAPRLGQTPAQFQQLAATIDTIYHNAAWVHSLHNYHALKPTNVDATRWMLQLASTDRPKHLHFISSLNALPLVDPDSLANLPLDERLRREWDSLPHGYAQTKWVSERLLSQAAVRGIGCSIYRPTFISGCSITGASNDVDLLSLFMDACFELRCVPDIHTPINMMPVDHVAARIVEISQQTEATGGAHNVVSEKTTDLNELAKSVYRLDPEAFPLIDAAEWARRCLANPVTATTGSALFKAAPQAQKQSSMPVSPSGFTESRALLAKYVGWRYKRYMDRPL